MYSNQTEFQVQQWAIYTSWAQVLALEISN